ncbi:MAG: 3'-5' exonuclease [Phototrophicales bacterium]|nr:MAG: 3'-5' exonuclease [Phototrophicales bacterium]
MNHEQDKLAAVAWARQLLDTPNAIILDFETTGIKDAEIVQIGIINMAGEVLLNTLVKPSKPVEPGAFKVHGISDAAVKDAPDFKDLYVHLSVALAGQHVVAYNVDFEKRVLSGVCQRRNFPEPRVQVWHCAMKNYARFYGQRHNTRRGYVWQSLSNACAQQNVLVKNAHDAIGDCLLTLAVIRKMASV